MTKKKIATRLLTFNQCSILQNENNMSACQFAKTDHHNFATNMKPRSHCCNFIGCNFESCQRFSVSYTGIEQREIKLKITSSLLWSAMSFKKIVCERLTEEARWYSTSWFKELNFTTHKKYFPAPSRKILKCCTLPPNLQKWFWRDQTCLLALQLKASFSNSGV